MSTPTTFMGLPNPSVGGDANTWGGFLNTCISGFDALAVNNLVNVSVTGSLAVFNGPVLVKATSGAGITLTLPDSTIAANKGRVYVITKVDAAVGTVTLAGFGGQTFSGAANLLISTQWASFTIQSDGVNWIVLSGGSLAGPLSIGATTFTGLFSETSQDTITAHAGGGQGSAFALTAQTNRITVVATVGDSVKLPASVAGLEIVVINHGANAMQVFGAGTDTIDDIATAVGVSQMAASVVIYTCATAGAWYTEGLANGYAGGLQTISSVDTLTAHAGGGQALGTAVTKMLNRFSVVATSGDSGTLLASQAGMEITVINSGAASMNLFPATGENMNGVLNASLAVTNTTPAIVYCVTTGSWFSK